MSEQVQEKDEKISEKTGLGLGELLSRIRPYLWPKHRRDHQWLVLAALAALLLSKAVNVATPWFFKLGVDELSGEADQTAWIALGALGLVGAYGASRLIGALFQQLRILLFAPVQERASRRIGLDVFRHLHQLSLSYHLSRRTGALARIVDRGVSALQSMLGMVLFQIGPLIIELAMISAVLFVAFDWRFVAIVLVTIALYTWFTFQISEWRVVHRRKMNDASREAGQKSLDSLLNFETVRYFAASEREELRYDEALAKLETATLKVNRSMVWLNLGQTAIITFGLIGVMGLAAYEVQRGQLTVGDFVMINAYMLQVIAPLNFLGGVYRQIRQSFVDMDEMFTLLDQKADIIDAPSASDLKVFKGVIEFKDVRFAYDPERPILKGISFRVDAGEKVAIVGPSGSGKSTIARLLFRFYDVTGGSIKIDKQDLREVSQISLQQSIGVVPQDTVLFNDSIRYNIAYGANNPDLSEIERAVGAAQLGSFIEGLPGRYETLVGERGLKLSGGEKQRMGIARTLLKDPPILILDEATSALDSETEAGIIEALDRAGEGRTVITIAHRLSTIIHADRIIVLNAGEIIETGTHSELLEHNGRYADMWRMQASENTGEDQRAVTAR